MVRNRKIQKGSHRRGGDEGQRGEANYNLTHRRQSGNSQQKGREAKMMHERNLQNSSFTNFEELSKKHTFLNIFLRKNNSGKLFYNFEKSLAIYFLSKATLKEYYGLNFYLPYVQCKELDRTLEHINVESNGEDGDNVTVQVNDIAQFKNTLLIMYNEYNHMLLNLGSEKEECVLMNEGASVEENSGVKGNFLCPNIPGRANYMHYIADLTALPKVPPEESASEGAKLGDPPGEKTSQRIREVTMEHVDKYAPQSLQINNGEKDTLLRGNQIKVLDIGVGSNCIYPLLGNCIYNWSFVGVDVNLDSLKLCYLNVLLNNKENMIGAHVNEVVYFDTEQVPSAESQKVDDRFGYVREDKTMRTEQIEADMEKSPGAKGNNMDTIYPFSVSNNSEEEYFSGIKEEVGDGLQRSGRKSDIPIDHIGGEYGFILNMIKESSFYFYNVVWFTTLVSKFKNVKLIKKEIIKSMRLYTVDNKQQVNFFGWPYRE